MGLEHLIAFNLALLAAVASPGPALLVAVQTSISAGRAAGVAVGCGLAVMASLWTLTALLGLEAIFTAFPWVYAAAKTVGALYLLYIAWRMWGSAKKPISAEVAPARRAFRDGLLINALNPKSVLFAAAVLVVILPPGLSLGEAAIVTANHLIVEIGFYSLLALTLNTPRLRAAYLRSRVALDRVAAVVLGALGLRLLLSR